MRFPPNVSCICALTLKQQDHCFLHPQRSISGPFFAPWPAVEWSQRCVLQEPFGYTSTTAGLMGAALLLVGLVSTIITAPIFDRVLTHQLALTCKCLCPLIGGAWLSLIWAGALPVSSWSMICYQLSCTVNRHNTGALFAIMAVIGACSLTLLPVALELAVELTRNANASTAMLWASSNLFSIILVLGGYVACARRCTLTLYRSTEFFARRPQS